MARTGRPLCLVRRLYQSGWDEIFENSAAAWAVELPERADWGGPVLAATTRDRAAAEAARLRGELLLAENPFALHATASPT